MRYIHPRERTARNLLRGVVASGVALIFLPTIVAVLIIAFNPASTGEEEEEDTIESIAFFTWGGLTFLLLVSTIALSVSSFIAYRRLSKEYRSPD